MAASAELNEFNDGRIIVLKGLGSQRKRSFAGYDPRIYFRVRDERFTKRVVLGFYRFKVRGARQGGTATGL